MALNELKVSRLGHPISNAWLVWSEEGPLLVDCGHTTVWPAILARLAAEGLRPRDLRAVLLTHRHSDHAANAARFEAEGVPIYAHRLDAECLSGQRAPELLPVRLSAAGAMCAVENHFPARIREAHALEDGNRNAGLTVRWTPGHTMGSICLLHAASGSLFSGDALLNAVPPLVVRTQLCLPSPDFSEDYPRALVSLARLVDEELGFSVLYPGHGPPWRGPLREAVQALLGRVPSARGVEDVAV
jgi:glyoxylase-like metal-dependent hydrolase (beta-lactamase superfamily II)